MIPETLSSGHAVCTLLFLTVLYPAGGSGQDAVTVSQGLAEDVWRTGDMFSVHPRCEAEPTEVLLTRPVCRPLNTLCTEVVQFCSWCFILYLSTFSLYLRDT